jgi:flagellar biosynthesis protein FlhG
MGNLKLETGQFIQISSGSPTDETFYDSELLSINKNFLEISIPFNNGAVVPFNNGFDLSLKTKTSFGSEYEFSSKIIGKNSTKQSLFISVPPEILKEIEAKTDSSNDNKNSCKFVTVISGKGGTGKTNFIINYALALAKKNKRVALVDADFGMANVDILLKLSPIYNITDVIRGDKALEEVIVDAPGDIKVVPGGSGIQELSSLNPYQLERIFSGFEYLENNFDFVLIDTSSGLSKNISDFVFASQDTIMVTTPEPHAISDAFSILRVLISKRNDINLKLVVNKCENEEESEAVVKRISGVVSNFPNCRFTPFGYIPESKLVVKAIKSQTPFFLAFPDSDVSSAIDSIADIELGIERKTPDRKPVVELSFDNVKNTSNTGNFVKRFKDLFARG